MVCKLSSVVSSQLLNRSSEVPAAGVPEPPSVLGTSVHAAGLVLEEVHVLARADELCVVPQDLCLLATLELKVVAEEVVGDEVLCEVGLWDAASRARLEGFRNNHILTSMTFAQFYQK